MALPTFVGASVTQSSVNAISNINWPSGHQSGDLGILCVQTSAEAPGVNPPTGFTEVPTASPQSIGTAATLGSVRLSVFYKIATSNAEAVVDVGDSGDHQVTNLTVWRGVDTSAPFDVNAGATAASSTAISAPSVTTTGADRLIVLLLGHAVDSTTNPVGSVANANLANLTNRKTSQTNVGTGGGFSTYSGEKATAGAIGATTGTLTTASAQALVTLSLKPPSAGTAPFGGFYVATAVKQVAGATGTSTGSLQNAAKQVRIVISLKPPVVVTNNPPVLDAIPDLLATVGDLFDYTVTASDPDSDPLTFAIFPGSTIVPNNLTINASTGQMLWTPSFVFQGTWNVKVRVTDSGGLFAEQAVNITVSGGPASAREVAVRATTDFESAKELVDLVLQAEQINAIVLDKAKILTADLGLSKTFMDGVIADLDAQNP